MRGRDRILNSYGERHHVIPKCVGGNDLEDNIVKLTYREHFICHWLLIKIYPENKKLLYAFTFMAYGKRNTLKLFVPSSRVLEKKKILLIESYSSKEHRQKISDGFKKHKSKHLKGELSRKKSLEKFLLKCNTK